MKKLLFITVLSISSLALADYGAYGPASFTSGGSTNPTHMPNSMDNSMNDTMQTDTFNTQDMNNMQNRRTWREPGSMNMGTDPVNYNNPTQMGDMYEAEL